MENYQDWTKYHIIYNSGKWKFRKENIKRAIKIGKDRNIVIKEALYHVCLRGGLLTVHYKDGTVDFIVDNWCG
jgi:hypothetical protein